MRFTLALGLTFGLAAQVYGAVVSQMPTPADKLEYRQHLLERSNFPLYIDENEKAGFDGYNNIYYLLDSQDVLRNVSDIHSQGFSNGQAKHDVWSSYFWPHYQGLVANRFWKSGYRFDYYYNLYRAQPTESIYQSGNEAMINQLSPAEKYDLLVGDRSYSLTQSSWAAGLSYWNRFGMVSGWYGLCDGVAAASLNVERPGKAIRVLAADGHTWITFYPQDLMALSALLWTNGTFNFRMIGGRCETTNPARDANGRVINPGCFDVNPGAWHMALANLVGRKGRSLVFDATYDLQVWNSPLVSYEFSYVNLRTGAVFSNPRDAMISLSSYTNDPFRGYRSTQAANIVGVQSKITYKAIVEAVRTEVNNSQYDATVNQTYVYDLELDGYGNILGGEWHSKDHPDFLWNIKQDTRASVPEDAQVGGWESLSNTIPSDYQRVAPQAAKRNKPLSKIIYQLVEWSN